jgi:surfactin synthase thioesterase subunit
MAVSGAPLVCWSRHAVDGAPLVCFPWAGAGAAAYRDWPLWLDEWIQVWGARLPAHESRIREAPVADIPSLAREFADAIERGIGRDPVLLGHCSGALLAYETAFVLLERGRLRPRQLLVIAQPPPAVARAPVEDVESELRRLGYIDELLTDAEMMALLRPALDADFRMSADFRHDPARRLDVPVTVFVGCRDATTDRAAALGWAHETTGAFEVIELDGDHLFTGADRPALVAAVGRTIAAHRPHSASEQTR